MEYLLWQSGVSLQLVPNSSAVGHCHSSVQHEDQKLPACYLALLLLRVGVSVTDWDATEAGTKT